MTVKELYDELTARIPNELSEEWDNDGVMCSSDLSLEVNRVLVALDVTEEVVDYAINEGFDTIVSHHPLIFKPLKAITEENYVASKVIKLLFNNISVLSFHTRLDKVEGGVNDVLAEILGVKDVSSFGEGGIGRIGTLSEECDLDDFANTVKLQLSADAIRVSDAYNAVRRVAIVGGEGKDFVKDAILAGADTYLSGSIGYHAMEDAPEMGINLIEAGHYFTEFPVTEFLSDLICSIDSDIYVEVADSNMSRLL